MKNQRANSFVVCGGAFGDEGKGRIVDKLVSDLSKTYKVVVYRDNGGANAGHTVEFPDGTRVALHQLPSGVFIKGATVILGKEMVLHPGDLILELEEVAKHTTKAKTATIFIDEMTVLSLDTHRAFETVLKNWQTGSKGSTGRGISPAYADVLLRHPLRMRDIAIFDTKKITEHYQLYEALIKGLGGDLAQQEVVTLLGKTQKVGSKQQFINRLKKQASLLAKFSKNVHSFLETAWNDQKYAFVFEKAQGIGLDVRWGVYPDVTASDTTPMGIFSATEGIIDPMMIKHRAGVIKATYMSSVGSRVLPTLVKGPLADKIREDAHEYGATTKRPRDIAYLDIPALKFFFEVGKLTHLMLTHMDISYPGEKIKICSGYKVGRKEVSYRPDQLFLDTVTPEYIELDSWDPAELVKAKNFQQLPAATKKFIRFLEKSIGVPVALITTGPQREQGISFHV